MSKIYVIGIGPGCEEMITPQAIKALEEADIIIGYTKYIELLPKRFLQKECLSTGMKAEIDRCRLCYEKAKGEKIVALVCSGDAGIYGLASLILSMEREYPGCEIEVIPGITAANSGAAKLGAPLNHDFCTISLSDLLTPKDLIEKRLICAAKGDFVIVLYNPSSKNRADYLNWACNILLDEISENTACGYVENIGREGLKTHTCTLKELRDEKVNMFTTVYIGNSQTIIDNNRLITPRGYLIEPLNR